ncbi:MAG: hypothetical protein M0Q51_09615 [Bacteroidales bacterium]|nr:hypothetical protein [Bacteroidales bacterium]
MKLKFFILFVLFLGIGAISYAQSQTSAPAEKKDAPAQVVNPDQGKSGECPGHQTTVVKSDCKWVDANNDGICDTCNKTKKDCMDNCKTGSEKKCDPAKCCPNGGAKPAGCCPSKDGKKSE